MVRRDFFDFCAAPGTSTSWEVLPRAEADLQGPRRAASFVEVRWLARPRMSLGALPELRVAGPAEPDLPELDEEMEDEGGGEPHVMHLHQYHADPMDEVAVAIISSGTTILFAMLGAALAMRLFRELLRPQRDSAQEVLQMDIPGIQPFQPFGGQAHRLEREEKRSGVVQSGNAAGQRSAPEEEREQQSQEESV
ncbi:unnamed protein product [Effrenium voratum]|uniref:Uncharacterized protein n=1 Tax=Effrenium voratum TaxID=2562239 RepID=A0AA36MW92_9DINO|nr:unnamed protein product [Effrenium voratum]CAJ1431607.1 unnamed protein product [Effrenium voratum]